MVKYETDTAWLKANITPAMLSQEDDLIRHAYSRPARIGETSPWYASIIHFAVYPGEQQADIERRVRIVFPGMQVQHVDSTMRDAVFDAYFHAKNSWQIQASSLSSDQMFGWMSNMDTRLDLRETETFATLNDGLVVAHAEVSIPRADKYRYELCGYIERHNSNGAVEHVEINDGGWVSDIGGRVFAIADNGRSFFLHDITRDRNPVRVDVAKGQGCRDTSQAPPRVSLVPPDK